MLLDIGPAPERGRSLTVTGLPMKVLLHPLCHLHRWEETGNSGEIPGKQSIRASPIAQAANAAAPHVRHGIVACNRILPEQVIGPSQRNMPRYDTTPHTSIAAHPSGENPPSPQACGPGTIRCPQTHRAVRSASSYRLHQL